MSENHEIVEDDKAGDNERLQSVPRSWENLSQSLAIKKLRSGLGYPNQESA